MSDPQVEVMLASMRAVNSVALSEVVTDEQIEAFIRQAEHEDVLASFFDPTAWMRGGHDNLKAASACAQAWLRFRKDVRKATGS